MNMHWLAGLEQLLGWLALISILTFVGSLVVVPLLITRLPVDYFANQTRQSNAWTGRSAVLRIMLISGKNILGLILLLAGLAMLVLPGQGLLTMLLGLTLMDFPGKYRLQQRLIAYRPVLRALNWIRLRSGVPAFVPGKDDTDFSGQNKKSC